MVILDECWRYGRTIIGFIAFLLIIIGIGILLRFLLMHDEFATSTVVTVTVIVISLAMVTFGGIELYRERYKEYKVYLQDMTLEEFETEYEPLAIEGLIIKATKKG